MTIENKIIIFLYFINCYTKSITLESEFGVSSFIISTVIHEMSKLLCKIFYEFIPNKFNKEGKINDNFSKEVVGVIDATIHVIRRPRNWDENKITYRFDKKCNFIQTHLIVDWDKKIIAASTNWNGSNHDSKIKEDEFFNDLCKDIYLIADTGYQGISWVLPGLKSNQIKDHYDENWDKVSRKEQKIVEHVNCAIKKAHCLSKERKFYHSRYLLLRIILFTCGLYNWALENKFKYNSNNIDSLNIILNNLEEYKKKFSSSANNSNDSPQEIDND